MKQLFILLTFFLFSSIIYSQTEDKKETPKDLMSSYYNEEFNPFGKGNWFVAFNMSFKQEDFKNTDNNFERVVDGTQKNTNYELSGGYFFSDNFAGKLGFIFGRETFDGTIARTLDTISRTSKKNLYGLSPALRSYIPLSSNNRLSLFVDIATQVAWGKKNNTNKGVFDINETSESKLFSVGAGIKSGLVFFAMENFAVEIGLEILTYEYAKSKSNNFGEPESNYTTNEIDFSIDLLSLNLSLSYYIGSNKNKK